MRKRHWMQSKLYTAAALAAFLSGGCRNTHKESSFLGDADQDHYRTHATEIAYPDVVTDTPPGVRDSLPPRTLDAKEHCEIRELQLNEAVHIGMANSAIVKSGGQFLSAGNAILNSADRAVSSYDSAIQESGVLFGGRGIEAALADFDAQLDASLLGGRNEQPLNSATNPFNVSDTGAFSSSLTKTFADGGQASLSHDVNYLSSNQPGLYPSSYSGNLRFGYQLPLLAGAGTEYTRVAGPIARSFGGITGVSQGVVIARINNDLVLCDYENALRNLTKDIEDAYWNLYLAYQLFDTASQIHQASIEASRIADIAGGETIPPENAAKAKDLLFAAKTAVLNTQTSIYTRETELRRLIGLPVNDGQILRPAEDPTTAEFVPDWHYSLGEALTQRVELRKQKWTIRSLDLQLQAARSLTRPRLDAVTSYQMNSLGDDLLAYGGSGNSFYQGLSANRTDGFTAGVVMNMPVGLRSARAQVQNYELRLSKAHKVLEVSEEEIAHELATAFQEVSRAYAVSQSNYNRYLSAKENVRITRLTFGQTDMDKYLDALPQLAQAQQAYFQSLAEYNKSITNLYYRKGTLLAYNNIQLAEGGWSPEAYQDAERLHGRRAYGHDIDVETEPSEFVSPVPPGRVDFTTFPTTPAGPAPTADDQEAYNPPVEETADTPE